MIEVTDNQIKEYQSLGFHKSVARLGLRTRKLVIHSPRHVLVMTAELSEFSDNPGIMQKAKNVFKTTVDVARSEKPVLIDVAIKENRLAICLACDYYKRGHCTQCGCDLGIKTSLSAAHCPKRKW